MRMEDLLSRLQNGLPETLQFLEAMVNTDSPTTEKDLVDRFGRFVGLKFEAIGGRAEYIPGARYGDHLRVSFGPFSGRPVLLLGHIDTVFSAGEAARRPFRVEDDRATGPGVFDMKGGIALIWAALRAIGQPDRQVRVLLNSDEEMGSPSSRELIEHEAESACAVLVLEPSLPGGVLKTARKGVGRFTLKATGRAAHAGIDPESGINAIEEIAHQILRVQQLSNPERGTTVTVCVVQGGTRVNVVPSEAAMEIDVRIAEPEEMVRLTEALHRLKPCVPGARLHVRGGINRPPMVRSKDTERLFMLARSIGESLGLDLREGSTGGGSDGNFTAALGIPTLDGLGPVGDGAHSRDEFIEVQSLPQRAALIAELIRRV